MNRSLPLFSCLAFLLIACNQNTRPMPPAAEHPGESKTAPANLTIVDPATAATIHGIIHFQGTAPTPVEIDRAQDPACSLVDPQPAFSEQFVVSKGRLANVYVYIKQGLEGRNFVAPSTPVILDQNACRYVPHVLAVMAGQTLRVLNSDPTMHNVHGQPNAPSNRQWNISQNPKGAPVDETFHDPEIMMPVKCNVHAWMKAFVNVAANPFYALSDGQGEFEIKGLPPGEYTIAAVHEALGEQTRKITVGAKESKTVDFTYTAQQ